MGRTGIAASRRRAPTAPRYARLLAQVDVVVAGLRRRVGQIFTLGELAEPTTARTNGRGRCSTTPIRTRRPALEPGTVADAAFHLYARGAADYRP